MPEPDLHREVRKHLDNYPAHDKPPLVMLPFQRVSTAPSFLFLIFMVFFFSSDENVFFGGVVWWWWCCLCRGEGCLVTTCVGRNPNIMAHANEELHEHYAERCTKLLTLACAGLRRPRARCVSPLAAGAGEVAQLPKAELPKG